MPRNVIITSANGNIGNFLINHWLKSLKENVNLDGTDIVVIDYGLNDKTITRLKNENIIVVRGSKKSHIVNKRFFDAGKFLSINQYDQVLFVDGGDIIFQDDFSPMFKKERKKFRVVPLKMEVLFFEWFMFNNFDDRTKKIIWRVIKNKPVINAGVIFAPTDKFIEMCLEMKRMTKNKDAFGPDQIMVNYFLYKSPKSFKIVDSKFNFMLSLEEFKIKNGIFYDLKGRKASIVHNAGQMDMFRSIDNFGYGKKNNKLKTLIHYFKRTQYSILGTYKKIFSS